MTPGANVRGATIDERANRFAKLWGVEVKEPEEIELKAPTPETDPTELRLSGVDKKIDTLTESLKAISDKLSGLVETLSAKPGAPVAPAGPVIPVVSKEKRSVGSSEDVFGSGRGMHQVMTEIDWDTEMTHGGSIVDRAQVLQQKMGIAESK